VTAQTYPTAAFGRYCDPSKPGADGYQILGSSIDFPQSALSAVKKLGESFQWPGGGETHRYPDCFALWPLESDGQQVLVARLQDAGPDQLNRPHSLRVEAVLVDVGGDLAREVKRLSALLDAHAWPKTNWSGPPEQLELAPTATSEPLSDALARHATRIGRVPRTLVGSGDVVSRRKFGSFELRVSRSPDGQTVSADLARSSQTSSVSAPAAQANTPTVPHKPSGGKLATLLLAAAFCIVVLIALWQWGERHELGEQRDGLEGEIAGAREELSKVKDALDKTEAARRAADAERKRYAAELQQWRNVSQELGMSTPDGLYDEVSEFRRWKDKIPEFEDSQAVASLRRDLIQTAKQNRQNVDLVKAKMQEMDAIKSSIEEIIGKWNELLKDIEEELNPGD